MHRISGALGWMLATGAISYLLAIAALGVLTGR
jgi:hypothetical protein